jgi:PAS domain S-box-containing protein
MQYLATVFDNIADGVVLLGVEPDDEYKFILANKPFYAFSGYAEVSSKGRLLSDIVQPDTRIFLYRHYKRVRKSRQPVEYSHWHDVPAGYRCFAVRLVPILGTTGDVILIACILRDVTEYEQLKSEVERLRKTVRGIKEAE